MNQKTAKQLVLSLSGMTLGIALMLPDTDFWRAIGMAILFVIGFMFSSEEQARQRVVPLLTGIGICMMLVVLSIYSDDAFAPRTGGPRTWYVVSLIATWAVCGIWEYGRWRGDRKHADAKPSTQKMPPGVIP